MLEFSLARIEHGRPSDVSPKTRARNSNTYQRTLSERCMAMHDMGLRFPRPFPTDHGHTRSRTVGKAVQEAMTDSQGKRKAHWAWNGGPGELKNHGRWVARGPSEGRDACNQSRNDIHSSKAKGWRLDAPETRLASTGMVSRARSVCHHFRGSRPRWSFNPSLQSRLALTGLNDSPRHSIIDPRTQNTSSINRKELQLLAPCARRS